MIQSKGKVGVLLGWLGALADPTRLRLLRLLEQHELGVAELCDIMQLPQSSVSRHLKVLADEGWAGSRRQGTIHLYRMSAGKLDPAARKLWLVARDQTGMWPVLRQDELRLTRRLRERRTQSEAFFAGAAGKWDKLRAELYGGAFISQALLALLPEDAVVADLGCGTGQAAAQLSPWVARVIGIDNSAAMLKAARSRTVGMKNVELHRGDLASVPIEDQTCDAALMLLVLSYVTQPATVLQEVKRILKPGGRAVIVDLLPHDREDFRQQMGQQVLGFEPEDVAKMLGATGLKASRTILLPGEADAKGPGLFLGIAVCPVGKF